MPKVQSRSKPSKPEPVTEAEYQCRNRKCGHKQWVRAHGPIEGFYSFGSDADFCRKCQKTPQATGRFRCGDKRWTVDLTPAIETVETTKVYDVKASVWCGGVQHYLWEVGAKVGQVAPDPFEGLTKLKGTGGRLRITMKVEVLKAGKVTKPFHPKGCHACGTKIRKHMHVLLEGRPLCGFSKEVPRDWPKGHWWVGFDDRRDADKVNCSMCIKERKRLQDRRARGGA